MSRFVMVCLLFSFSLVAKNPVKNIGVITNNHYAGEREVAWRIKIAGERLGWSVLIDEDEGKTIEQQPLDWVICLLPENQAKTLHFASYLTIFHPFNFLDRERKLLSFYEKYDGFLITLRDAGNIVAHLPFPKNQAYLPFFPTPFATAYQQVPLQALTVFMPAWGTRVTNPKYQALHQWLSESSFAALYGPLLPPLADKIRGSSYRGMIPFDGFSTIEVLQQNGIALVIHSDIHNQEGIPSARIFEAAAASCVIICDQNSFASQVFGDSLFYIDTSSSAASIFEQIYTHMQTIELYPEKAWHMAKKAHDIFIAHFTMEKQLLDLEKIHNRLKP